MHNNDSSPTITDCSFVDNVATKSYGGQGAGMLNSDSTPMVTDCIFHNNRAGSVGGGMANYHSSPTVTDCTFSGNYSGYEGGGMFNGGSSPSLINCILYGNSAESRGAGMYNFVSAPAIVNSTFAFNESLEAASPEGTAIYNDDSSPEVTNSMIWSGPNSGEATPIFNEGDSSPRITYSNVQGGCDTTGDNPCTTEATGNIDADPLFADIDAEDGEIDLRLTCEDKKTNCSPCIDVGLDSAVPSEITTDMDSNERIVDIEGVGNEETNVVDMGAYEL
jgi:hypothetical protein